SVRSGSAMVDVLLVVGSKNSSNSNRLREVARSQGIPAYLIDDAGEIDLAWLENVTTVGVTAGASAPEHLVTETANWLLQHGAVRITEMEGEEERITFQLPDMQV
ncbi:4-hydroxy-3-methylbut-2-enyl diphosphate reductase, partial [Desulfobulbus sp. F3]|nr:4-hydroxy-3-methylbut-2-enyl diphosphate reductase [Desulfobulbus sp. F3]